MTTPWSAKPKAPKKPKTPEPPKEENPGQNATRVWGTKGRQSPRHSNTVRRVLRVGQMAWEGCSAGEIADEIGVGTQYVYQLCSDYRIKLVPKTRFQYAFRVNIELKTLARLERLAAERGDDVTDLIARMIDALSREPVLLSNLIDEDDEPAPRKKRKPREAVTKIEDHDDDRGED